MKHSIRIKKQLKYIFIFIFNLIYNLTPFFFLKKLILNIFSIKIGNASSIHIPVKFFSYNGNLTIGNNTTINPGCYLDNRAKIEIGENVNISHSVRIYTAGHNPSSSIFEYFQKSVKIDDNVWIFPNVLIMPGVHIRKGAVIYPGSVVTHDVNEYTIVAGNPAKKIAIRAEKIDYLINHDFWFIN